MIFLKYGHDSYVYIALESDFEADSAYIHHIFPIKVNTLEFA